MSQFILLGIVAVAVLIIAPLVGASTTVKIDPNQSSSPLLARTVFDIAEEGADGEDIIDRRDELREDGKLEERRDDARRWSEEND
ncbi:MAG: hypothetical protein Kow00121_16190 [Elainellaceae cyanobacterium]